MTLTKPFLLFLVLLIGLSSVHFQPSYGVTYLFSFQKWDSLFRIPIFTVPNAIISTRNNSELFQFNITLAIRPAVNSISINIERANLTFYYQPPLDQELNLTEYDFVNATHAIKNGVVIVYRPENVVGSYAVYGIHANNQYQTGKLFHLYRSLLIAANGAKSWATLTVVGNVLTITASSTWLASAVYPVVIDPSFGYTTIGSTLVNPWIENTKIACRFQADGTGTVTQLNWRGKAYSGSDSFYGVIYSDNSGSPNALLATSTGTTVTTTESWYAFSISLAITTGTYYWLGVNFPIITPLYRYDTGLTNQLIEGADWGDDPPPSNPFGSGTYFARKMSIYANYTVSGGQDFTFTVGSPIHIIASVTSQRALSFPLSVLAHAINSATMRRETIFTQTGLIHIYGTATMNKAAGFLLTGMTHLISSLTIAKEMLFTSTALMKLISVLEQATEIVVTEITVIRSGTVYPSSSLGIGKELAFTQTPLIRLISYLSENKEFGAVLNAVLHPSSMLAVAKEMLFRISQTIKPIAVLLPAFEVYMEIYETFQNVLIVPYHLLTVDSALGISETFALALIAFIFAMAAIALVMLKRRSG